MQYDLETPIAVFLGPSLKKEQADAILKANYYPPIRMGDIYRLLATNIQVIVIIDGFFHANVPVWQREILAALKAGIAVIGAASMGALRAVELAPYGMIGIGEVYRWYEQELIEGDDEVALLHLDIEHNYYPLSEPLVNIRYTLEKARLAGILGQEQSLALQRELKQLYYGDRTYAAIFNCASFQRLSLDEQRNLQCFINTRAESIKQSDALEALRYCADHAGRSIARQSATLKPGIDIERPIEIHCRGVLSEQGQLLKLQELLMLATQDNARIQRIVHEAGRRFFLLQWQKLMQLKIPGDFLNAYKNRWYRHKDISDIGVWLSRNGLTHAELEQELADRAAAEWLLEQTPTGFDTFRPEEFTIIESCFPDLARRLTIAAIINDWAVQSGIDVPATVLATATEHQHRDFQQQLQNLGFPQTVKQRLFDLDFIAQKIVEKTPVFFGFDLWSIDIVLARELQLQGDIAKLAQHWQQPAIHA